MPFDINCNVLQLIYTYFNVIQQDLIIARIDNYNKRCNSRNYFCSLSISERCTPLDSNRCNDIIFQNKNVYIFPTTMIRCYASQQGFEDTFLARTVCGAGEKIRRGTGANINNNTNKGSLSSAIPESIAGLRSLAVSRVHATSSLQRAEAFHRHWRGCGDDK